MFNKCKMVFLIAAVLAILSGCGKQQEQFDTTESTEVVCVTNEVNAESSVEDAESVFATEKMMEYTFPEGEGVDSAETFTEEDDLNGEKSMISEEEQDSEKPSGTISPIVTEKEDCDCEYSNYAKMSPAEQEEYMNSFATPLDFIEWSKNALAEHEAHDTTIQASGGDLDISDYIK